jgi:hypothetical protein
MILGPDLRVNCVVRDISATGAKLGVSEKIKLPAGFHLLLVKAQSKRAVLVRWRRGDFVGVEFCSSLPLPRDDADKQKNEIWIV